MDTHNDTSMAMSASKPQAVEGRRGIELQADKPNLEAFAETLEWLASTDRDILAVVSDSRGSGKLVPFGKKFPNQIIEVGIAEQNLVGIASGLASAGKKVFAVSPACFLTARALEQIKTDVAYSNNPVKLIGISAGVSYGALGSTHHSLHDFAVLRAIHNMIVVAPADNFETRQAIELAAGLQHPIYIRFGKKKMPLLRYDGKHNFGFGKGRVILKGSDITLIATGEAAYPALQAAEILRTEYGIDAALVSMHTIKPFDYALLHEFAANGKPIVTVEEHSIFGGLGETCASYLLQNGLHNKFKIVGIPDEYTVTGSQVEIFNHYGISGPGIADTALRLLSKK